MYAENPFLDTFHRDSTTIIRELDELDIIQTTETIMSYQNGPFTAACYEPGVPSDIWRGNHGLYITSIWSQLRLNKTRISIGNQNIVLNVSPCRYCENNVQMDLYHIVMECLSLEHYRREFIEPIVTKVQLNFSYSVFKLLFYNVTREEVFMISKFLKAVVFKELV